MSYRTDPQWIAAHERYLADQAETETVGDVYTRRCFAIMEMYRIEVADAQEPPRRAAPGC
jgi:hypothetical protein